MTDVYDSPWKDVLDRYLKDFFALLFPEIHSGVDWSRPPESLEKELRKIVRDAELGKRLADKLYRVYRKDGQEIDVLINIEVQETVEKEFPKRLFIYNYRSYDRFDRPVVSVAVLCDEQENYRPTSFTACDLWGCEVKITFPVAKLRDYNSRWKELETSTNPFATVVMAHLKTQATRKNPQERFHWKLRLVRQLYEKGYPRNDVIQLFRFIDWVMALPEELERKLDRKIEELEEERQMQYVTGIERRATQRGVKEGIQQGAARILQRLLQRTHGDLPNSVEQKLKKASSDELERWADRVLTAKTLDEVFR